MGRAELIDGIAGRTEREVFVRTADRQLSTEAMNAVRTYLTDPRSITVSTAPDHPVPLSDILYATTTISAAALLALSVHSND